MDSDESRTYDIKVDDYSTPATAVADLPSSDDPGNLESPTKTSYLEGHGEDTHKQTPDLKESPTEHSDKSRIVDQLNETSIDSLLPAQLCNCCLQEKARVICTVCSSDPATPNFTEKIPTAINISGTQLSEHDDESADVNKKAGDEIVGGAAEVDDKAAVEEDMPDKAVEKQQTPNVEQLMKSMRLFLVLSL